MPPAAKPSTTTTDIAITDQTIKNALVSFREPLELFAPRGLNVSDWLQTAMLCISENKKLRTALTTEKGKSSLIHALKYGISTGVSLNPQEGKAALVPFNEEIVFMTMKNGLAQMALDTGMVESIDCDIVRENDGFSIKKTGKGDDFEFSPARKDRGAVDGYFAFVQMKNGGAHIKYMTVGEIEEWRDTKVPEDHLYRKYDDKYETPPRYKKGDKIEDGLWWKNPDAMALKTVTRQLLLALKIPTIEKAVEAEEESVAKTYRDVTEPPAPKGTGGDDLAAKLAAQANPAPAAEPEIRDVTESETASETTEQELPLDEPPAATAPAAPAAPPPGPPRTPPRATPASKPETAPAEKAAATGSERPPLLGDTICMAHPEHRFRKGEVDAMHLNNHLCPKCGGELADDGIF